MCKPWGLWKTVVGLSHMLKSLLGVYRRGVYHINDDSLSALHDLSFYAQFGTPINLIKIELVNIAYRMYNC